MIEGLLSWTSLATWWASLDSYLITRICILVIVGLALATWLYAAIRREVDRMAPRRRQPPYGFDIRNLDYHDPRAAGSRSMLDISLIDRRD